jgi:linoleoyl-CoA desaturase
MTPAAPATPPETLSEQHEQPEQPPKPEQPDQLSQPKPTGKVKFPKHSGLRAELNRRVDAYFKEAGISRVASGAGMWFKTLFLVSAQIGTWAALMLWATEWWQLGVLAVLAGLSSAGIGFAIMHDGNHGAYSQSTRWNRLMGYTLDLVGGSSYIWRFKHNVLHHTYPNVQGLDDDIEAEPFLRMAATQPRYPWHRLQQWYCWFAYGLLPVKWHFIDDFSAVIKGNLNGQPMARPRGWDLALLLFGKVFFFSWALVLPLMFHSVAWCVASYLILAGVSGIALGTVFQMAHCVENVDFAEIPAGGRMELPWAEHQLATTANFAPTNRLLTWYIGGLNYQVEHHLFPKVGHVHYPAITKIVQEVCAEFGVTHRVAPTLFSAMRAHFRYFRELGRPVAAPVS